MPRYWLLRLNLIDVKDKERFDSYCVLQRRPDSCIGAWLCGKGQDVQLEVFLVLVLLAPHYFVPANSHQVPKHKSMGKKAVYISLHALYSEAVLKLRIRRKHQSSDFCTRT